MAEHLAALQHIHARGEIPAPMAWWPKEVLALTRWTEPQRREGETEGGYRRAHLIRAFACAVLLQAAADPANANDDTFEGENGTLAQLIGSVLVLGHDVIQAARQFVAWRICSCPPEDTELPFFVFGMVLLTIAQGVQEQDERRLAWWVEAVFTVEQRVRETVDVLPPASGHLWLLGLTFYDTKHEVWRALARRLLCEVSGIHTPALRAKLIMMGTRLQTCV